MIKDQASLFRETVLEIRIGLSVPFVYNGGMDISFYKLALAGCDFLLVNGITAGMSVSSLSPSRVAAICDRRNGVGAEGVILLYAAAEQNAGIAFFGAGDGKRSSSGAAFICAARYAFDFGLFSGGRLVLETGFGDVEITGIGSRLFQIDLGTPVSATGKVLEEDEALEVEVWMPAGGRPVAYTSLRFPALAETRLAVVLEKLDGERRLAFGARPESGGIPVSSVFATAVSGDRIEYQRQSDHGRADCVAEAAACAVASACSGSVTREVTVVDRDDSSADELFVNWTGNGSVAVSGVPRYIFTGDYSTEDDDGPAD